MDPTRMDPDTEYVGQAGHAAAPSSSRAQSTHRHDTTIDSSHPTASQVTVLHNPQPMQDLAQEHPLLPRRSSDSTTIPYLNPSPPDFSLPSVPSSAEIYGPDRYEGHPPTLPGYVLGPTGSPAPVHPIHSYQGVASAGDPLAVHDFKDELARLASTVTPGVDDGPYIRHAMEALTNRRENEHQYYGNTPSGASFAGFSPSPFAAAPTTYPVAQHASPLGGQPFQAEPLNRHLQTAPPIEEYPDDEPRSMPSAEELLQEKRSRRARAKAPIPKKDGYQPAPLYEFNPLDIPGLDSDVEDPALPRVTRRPPRSIKIWQPHPASGQGNGLHEAQQCPPLTHKPWILRPASLLLLMTLCVLMITALIFSAIYSINRNGFTPYDNTIYGGQYFLFRMLPQLIGIMLLIYAQDVIIATFRILPFSMMASEDYNERSNAVFLPMYPKTFLWPQLVGPWNVWVPTLNVWLMNITIPLLSSLYTVVLVDGTWRWSTVQGVVWTLVALYVSLLISVVILFVFWRRRTTGMMKGWDIRSLADIIFLVSQSNSLEQYRGLDTAATRQRMRNILDGMAERLGYWSTPKAPENGIFYSIGLASAEPDVNGEKMDARWASKQKPTLFGVSADVEAGRPDLAAARYRYLPWCLRDSSVAFFAVAAGVLFAALVAVCFTPATDIRHGFAPDLRAAPRRGSFSPADFLYAFLPALLGTLLFLAFQSLDLHLRALAPWGELARRPEGARAADSLLLDYAATLAPLHAAAKAAANRHYRVAALAALAPAFALLPVLAGGLFLALVVRDTGQVRMFPHVPALAVLLALLAAYVLALAALVPDRRRYALPHAASCLAEVFSFLPAAAVVRDPAFADGVVTGGGGARAEVESRLDVGRDWHRQGRWGFGEGGGGGGKGRAGKGGEGLGVRRVSRFTVNPRKLGLYDRRARGELISAPLPKGSGSLFGGRFF
ncbi:hypothetical protein F4780DRAFT_360192 [Xylariomycetidae sp. FL0641]|nr:hypothetical protein F4780DRAFT_360192 [Xylariomycetidae sp. FL0641]